MIPNANQTVDNNAFDYLQWRSKFLKYVLWILCVLGVVPVLLTIPSASTSELVAFVILYAILLAVTFAPLSYAVKAGTLVALGYFLALFTLVRFGPWSDSSLFFLAATIFSALLFDGKIDRFVIALNVITMISVALLDTNGQLSIGLGAIKVPKPSANGWATYIADYVVIAVATTWAINLLKNEFRTIAKQLQHALSVATKSREELEQRVDERTSGLFKKTDQLRAASYIARKTAEAQDLPSLLNAAVRLITDQFGYYHSGIFLLNESGDEVILQAASSEGGKRMLDKGHHLLVGSQGIVGFVAAQKRPRIALDVGTDAAFFNNPDLPSTHSEVGLPLLIGNRLLGVLDIQSDQPEAFNMDEIDVLQTIADQIAIAIENTRLLDNAQAALKQVEALTNVRAREAWDQRLKKGGLAYTYTPLGLRSGKASDESDKSIKVPITLRGHKIGDITLTRKDEASWDEVDRDLISEVANQTGLAMENLRLVEDATQRARQEQTIGELAARFGQSMDIDGLLQTAARELGQVVDVAEVSVFIGTIPEQAAQRKRTKRSSG
jgi:GAF domain-containing protein